VDESRCFWDLFLVKPVTFLFLLYIHARHELYIMLMQLD
jgi:hypothetical protein